MSQRTPIRRVGAIMAIFNLSDMAIKPMQTAVGLLVSRVAFILSFIIRLLLME